VGSATIHLDADAVIATVDAANAAAFSCPSPTVAAMDLAPGTTIPAPITWLCTTSGGAANASSTLGATVSATDTVSGAAVNATVNGVPVSLQ
jgi:hypothetical protein